MPKPTITDLFEGLLNELDEIQHQYNIPDLKVTPQNLEDLRADLQRLIETYKP